MKCELCDVTIPEHRWRVSVLVATALPESPEHVVRFCSPFCAAVAMDKLAMMTVEAAPEATRSSEYRRWASEHVTQAHISRLGNR